MSSLIKMEYQFFKKRTIVNKPSGIDLENGGGKTLFLIFIIIELVRTDTADFPLKLLMNGLIN
jgi:hypothetical protein